MAIYFQSLIIIMSLMTILWIISVIIKNASIVDLFWGFGFLVVETFYFFTIETPSLRQTILLFAVFIWSMRLTIYLSIRNIGKGEDFRYQEFRKSFGEKRYWWISFFQTFGLQGILIWIISIPFLGANIYPSNDTLNVFDYLAIIVWLTGFIFEAGGDYQLTKFKSDPKNKGKVLNTGLWKYTRHPNYFGDSAVWWGFGLFSIASGAFLFAFGAVIMTLLIIKVSGVALLEKTLNNQKPEYEEYARKTSSFLPWFPKK